MAHWPLRCADKPCPSREGQTRCIGFRWHKSHISSLSHQTQTRKLMTQTNSTLGDFARAVMSVGAWSRGLLWWHFHVGWRLWQTASLQVLKPWLSLGPPSHPTPPAGLLPLGSSCSSPPAVNSPCQEAAWCCPARHEQGQPGDKRTVPLLWGQTSPRCGGVAQSRWGWLCLKWFQLWSPCEWARAEMLQLNQESWFSLLRWYKL